MVSLYGASKIGTESKALETNTAEAAPMINRFDPMDPYSHYNRGAPSTEWKQKAAEERIRKAEAMKLKKRRADYEDWSGQKGSKHR